MFFLTALVVVAVTIAAPGDLQARMAATRVSASDRLPSGRLSLPVATPGKYRTHTFDPIAYGGDPTGRTDSTAAVQAALAAANAVAVPGGFVGNSTSHGGAVVDLMGGQFAVSQTLWFGSGGGVRLTGGSLKATDNFTVGQPMVAVQGEGLEDITIDNLMLDCSRRGGGLSLDNVLRAHLFHLYVVHYTTVGIAVSKGHEVHIESGFLGEWIWGEDGPDTGTNLTGTAIEVDGQDHWITDVVIFSGLHGIVLNGGASVITNSHIYNGGTEALLGNLGAEAVKVTGSYFDGCGVVLLRPVAVSITNSLFLGGVGIELRSTFPGAWCAGNLITGNQFIISSGNAYPPATYGDYSGMTQQKQATTATLVLHQTSQSLWHFDFSELLVFDIAPTVVFTIEAATGFPVGVVRARRGRSVTIETSKPFTGSITVTARQAD
eukprot:gene6713-35339_t